MNANTDSIASVADANMDFSKVARMDFGAADKEAIARDEDVLEVSRRLIEKNREAYKDLAK